MSWRDAPIAPEESPKGAAWASAPVVAPSPRDVLGVAAKVNPDQAAEAERLAKRYPAPSDVLLRNLTDAKLQAAVDDADAKLNTDVPALRARMTDIPFARQAHDDVGVLSSIEGFLRQTGRSIKSGVYGADRGAAGVFQAGAEFVAPVLDVLETDPFTQPDDWRTRIGGNPLRRLAEGFAAIGAADAATQKALRPQQPQGNISAGFFSGVESLTQNLLMLPAAFLPGGQGVALTGMVGMTGGNAYQDAREKGLGMSQALPFAASQAAIEYATERIPLSRLIGDVKAGTPIMQTLMRQIGAEIPGEQVATILQDLNEWAVLNPDKPFTSYLEERPSAAAQTLVATIVGAGGNVAVAKALESVVTRAVGQDADVQRSDADLQRFEKLLGAAAESKLRERAPETFAQFVNEAAANTEGAPTAVYVDARALTDALNQAGITDEQLAEVLPSVPGQIEAAFEAGSPVEIPIGEALAAAPGTPIEQVLLQNARLDPEGLSRAEVEEATKQAEQFVRNEAERVMQQAADRQALEQSADAVRTTILDQLNQTKRFRPEANAVYADMVRAFYATMAQRTGVTPEELYAKYPLRVAAEGSGQLGQGGLKLADLPRDMREELFNLHAMGVNPEATEKAFLRKTVPTGTLDISDIQGIADIPAEQLTRYQTNGLPPVVIANGQLVDGNHRIAAYKALGLKRIKAVDLTGVVNPDATGAITSLREGSFTPDALEQPGTRATFSPEQMLIVLGQNADLSSFLHESGHFFLEVLADLGSQPGAPEQIAKDWQTTLEWFGVAPEAWGQMTLDQKRPYHERWAESVEQYFFEGRAPSVELRGVFDRFRTWLTSVYKSLKRFLAMRELTPGGQAAAVGTGELAQPGTPAFDKWFGDSKVVDAEGKPLVVYHGTNATFSEFSKSVEGELGAGYYFTASADSAEQWGMRKTATFGGEFGYELTGEGVNLMPVFLSIQNPAGYKDVVEAKKSIGADWTPEAVTAVLREKGFDGIWSKEDGELIAFSPEQIKSAIGNRGTFDPNDPNILNQSAYHGTPHRGIEKFSTDKIGTGEGAQAYGWGLYFAGKKDVAEWYRKNLSYDFSKKLVENEAESAGTRDPAVVWSRIKDYFEKNPNVAKKAPSLDSEDRVRLVLERKPGQLYEVDIPEDSEMLLWDKPLSEQPPKVREALEKLADQFGYEYGDGYDGGQMYRALTSDANAEGLANGGDPQKAASDLLATYGIKGIKYLDGTSRGAGDGTFNYVVFSGDDVAIKNQFYQSDAPAAGPLGLSDEIRQVMDRLLATDEQIAEAERVRQYGLLFKSPEEAGMTPEQWAKYVSDDEKAHAEALNELGKKSLKNLGIVMRKRMRALKEVQRDMAEKRKAVEAEAAAIIAKEPVYQAMRWLKKGEMTTAEGEEIKVTDGFKLDTASVEAIFPEPMLGRPILDKLKGMTRKSGGLSPDIVAEMFGFRDGAHLITSIAEAFPQDEQVQGLTDQMMLERYGEDATPRGMERAADEAVHNENRARVLAAEMAAVNAANNARAPGGGTRTVNAMVEAAKQFATNLVGRKKVKDLKPNVHTAAETRAAKAAERALAKGDTAAVIQAKRDQLLNFHAARATNEARIEAAKIEAFFKKVATAKDDTVGKTRDIDVVKAAQAILSAYGLTTEAKGKSAAEYLRVLEANDPTMYGVLRDSVDAATAAAKPMNELTMDELRALHDEVQAMWYLAKRSRQMEVDGNLLDLQDVEDALKGRMLEIGIPDTMPGDTSAITKSEERLLKFKSFLAAARRVESWVGAMDGKDQTIGVFRRYIWQPVKEAADRYRTDKGAYLRRYEELLKPLAGSLRKRQIEAPELNYVFGKDTDGVAMSEILHAILHTGNESNKRKLLLGRRWATENADGTLDTRRWDAFIQRLVNDGTLTPAHFDFAQGVWDMLEDMKPLAQKTHRAVFGKYFAEVTANEFVDPFGVRRRGGYIPATADSRIVSDQATKRLAEDENASLQFAFPTTPKGFTKSRVDYNAPLLLDLRSLSQHIDKVLKFSHMEQHVRDVRKALTAKGVAYGLNRIDPVAFDAVLTPWLRRAAMQQVETPILGDRGLLRFFSVLRNRAGMAAMFANVANAAQQVTGFSIAAVKLKRPSLMVSALAEFAKAPRQMQRTVADASPYMASRMENEVAMMSDAINAILLDPNVYEKGQRWFQKHAYFLQSAVDNITGPIIWTAAYNDALEQGNSDKDAKRFADSVIRETQGSTLAEDVSRIETGNPFVRLFTQFMGYFNMQANLLASEFKVLMRDMGLRAGAGRAMYAFLLGFYAPAVVAELIMQAFRGGPDDEERDGYLDDWLAQVFGLSAIRGATAMVPVAGPLATAAVNATNNKPYDDRISTSPAISMLESSVRAPMSVYKAIAEDANQQKAVRESAVLLSLLTGIPVAALAKPVGYAAAVEQGKVTPTSPADAARGAITGTASPESKSR